jgi:hypothetical protein
MKRFCIFTIIIFTTLMLGCATTEYVPLTKRIAIALTQKNPTANYTVLYIESPKGFISKKIAIASLKLGEESNDMKAIIGFLTSSKDTLAIAGSDAEFTSETTIQAFKKLKGKTLLTNTIAYVGEVELKLELEKVALEAGVKIDFVSEI